MRWYGMYYICKECLESVAEIKLQGRIVNGINVTFLDQWLEIKGYLNEIKKIPVMEKYVSEIYACIPEVFIDRNRFDLDSNASNKFVAAVKRLYEMMEAVIEIYESMSDNCSVDEGSGFDIKLPEFRDLKEFGECMQDLDFVITKCPYLRIDNSEIRFDKVDIGSFWISFFVAGSASVVVLQNLAALIDKVIKIRSHYQTLQLQKEELRKAKIKNDVLEAMLKNLDDIGETLKKTYVEELEDEIHPLENGEEKDVAGRSIDKLLVWMDKGMEIYSAIESSGEIKDLFPKQTENVYLSDELIKLLEMKK